MTAKPLAISLIERDMLLQPRAELHRDWIEDYALDMANGAVMPPIIVYRDDDKKHWLADGFHRTYAAEAAGLAEILAEIRKGTRRDALLHSVSANAEHGHRRTNDDKRRAVDIMLRDPQWSRWPNRDIARKIGVDEGTIRRRKEALSAEIPQISGTRTVTRNGTTYDMNITNIGGGSVEDQIEEEAAEHEASIQPKVEPFDWNAARIRREAMDAIRSLASQPPPHEVIAAWMKTMSYGEPVETMHKAIEWLTEFANLYREAEPARWHRVQQASQNGEAVHAAE